MQQLTTEQYRSLSAEKAFSFLCDRMPSEFDIPRVDWVVKLMNYQEYKGDEAIESLAGFYLLALNNLEGDRQSEAIAQTLSHDLKGAKDQYCLPKSSDETYLNEWRSFFDQYNSHKLVTNQ